MFDGYVYAHSSVRKPAVLYIRSFQLIESRSSLTIADSPDAILACPDEMDQKFVCATDIKTMTELATVNEGTLLRDYYGAVSMLSGVGSCQSSDEIIRALVSSTEYRAQCMHHEATLGLRHVLYVVGTSGNATQGVRLSLLNECGIPKNLVRGVVFIRENPYFVNVK